jgi:hypothetical protein
MVQVNQAMINPTVARADYSQLTNAVIRGQDQELLASKEKNARIRASLAEVEMNNRASADAQASWMGAVSQNESLLNALDKAPPRIQKAYQKATQGRATLEDNSVISSYLGSIQNQIALEKQDAAVALKNNLTQAQIDAAGAAQQASISSKKVSDAKALSMIPTPGQSPEQKTINALLSNRVMPDAGASAAIPPAAAINASDPNDPVSRPVAGVALPEPTPIPVTPAEQTLIDDNPFAPQATVAATEPMPEVAPVDPNAPFFTDAKGNRVVASPEVVNSPEVKELIAANMDTGTAIQLVQANKDLTEKRSKYMVGAGNPNNLIPSDIYQAQLVAAGNDLDDAREQTTAAIAQGIVYAPATAREMDERKKEFDESFKRETTALSALLEDQQIVENAALRAEENLGWATSGFLANATAKIGFDFMPFDGKSNVAMKRALSQLTSSSALTTMQELKDNSKQGATGLGQVSVVEFTSLIDKASSIDQALQPDDLKAAIELYKYDRNKAVYKAYRSMVDEYGAAAINSVSGISERQISRILQDINTFETGDPVGMKIAARSGYFVDEVGVPQAPVTTDYVAPPVLDFFGNDNSNTQAYGSNIKNISTRGTRGKR